MNIIIFLVVLVLFPEPSFTFAFIILCLSFGAILRKKNIIVLVKVMTNWWVLVNTSFVVVKDCKLEFVYVLVRMMGSR